MSDVSLIILNRYEILTSVREFETATSVLAERVEREGHPGVLTYRFFSNCDDMTGRAIVEYRDGDAWIGHHEIAMSWPEMKALHSVAVLREVVFLGEVTQAIHDWFSGSSLRATILDGNVQVAGFRRSIG